MARTAARWGIIVTFALTACGSEEEQPPEQQPATRTEASNADRPHEHEDSLDAKLVLVAGTPGTSSHRLAHALQNAAREVGEDMSISSSASDLDPLYLVAWGHADAGIVPSNVLASSLHRLPHEAVKVIGVFEGTDAVHVIVADASSTRSVADLQGKVISVGRLGSASAMAAHDVLLASGLDADGGEVTLEHHAPQDAIKLLGAGIDAVIMVGHCDDVPGAPRTRILALPQDDATAVTGAYPIGGYSIERGELVVRTVVVARPGAADVMEKIASARGSGRIDSLPPATVDGPPLAFRQATDPLRIAAGPAGGTYQKVADGIARVVDHAGLGKTEVVPTQGAFESFVLLATGQVDVAIVKEDMLDDALRTPAIAPLVARTRLLTPLYREEVHLAVVPDTRRALEGGLAGLKGKKVVLGEPGSGTFATARRVLQLSGMQRGDIVGRALGPLASIEALRAGRVDAVFFVGGQPVSIFEGSNVSFVPIGPLPGYQEATLSYPWLPGPVQTVSTQALLLCRRDLASDVAEKLVTELYANRRNLSDLHPKWSELDPANLEAARRGLRLHSAVEASAKKLEPDSAPAW